MPISKERFTTFLEGTKECLKGRGVDNVEFRTTVTDELLQKPISEHLCDILGELAENCIDKGAKTVIITLTDNHLRVEDDVFEPDPEVTLKFLNEIKNSGKRVTTKDKERIDAGCCPEGGMGIAKIVMGFLNLYGGRLEYSVKDGKIIAEATWE